MSTEYKFKKMVMAVQPHPARVPMLYGVADHTLVKSDTPTLDPGSPSSGCVLVG